MSHCCCYESYFWTCKECVRVDLRGVLHWWYNDAVFLKLVLHHMWLGRATCRGACWWYSSPKSLLWGETFIASQAPSLYTLRVWYNVLALELEYSTRVYMCDGLWLMQGYTVTPDTPCHEWWWWLVIWIIVSFILVHVDGLYKVLVSF